jgi:hypothetical protein
MNLEMLEIVLTELLEEQKKETITNAEMVSIVKRLLEKLENMEQLIQPKDGPTILERLRAIQIACQGRTEKPTLPSAQITQVQTVIKHHFYFKTTAVIATAFFMLIVTLSWLYLGKRKELNTNRANDIKYRYLKLNANPNLKKILLLTDSLYLFAPDSMQKKVVWIERQLREQWELSEKASNQEKPEKRSSKKAGKTKHLK